MATVVVSASAPSAEVVYGNVQRSSSASPSAPLVDAGSTDSSDPIAPPPYTSMKPEEVAAHNSAQIAKNKAALANAPKYKYDRGHEVRFAGGAVPLNNSVTVSLDGWRGDVKRSNRRSAEDNSTSPPRSPTAELDPKKVMVQSESKDNLSAEEIKKRLADPTVKFIPHKVHPSDDLCALAVRYHTTEELIRQYNRRVIFDALDNVCGETLQIPVRHGMTDIHVPAPDPAREAERIRREKIRNFQTKAAVASNAKENSIHESEALFYLDENEFDVDAAVKQYKEDVSWEAAHPNPITSTTTSSTTSSTTTTKEDKGDARRAKLAKAKAASAKGDDQLALLELSNIGISASGAPPSYAESERLAARAAGPNLNNADAGQQQEEDADCGCYPMLAKKNPASS